MKEKLKLALLLFLDYFKIGLFTFGGGYAMISLIETTFVDKRKYISKEELLNIVTIAESTPGVIAINSATFIGYKVLKVIGSIIATIAVSLPSFIIIIIVSIFYDKFINIAIVKAILSGLFVGVTFLILNSGYKLYKNASKDALSYILIGLSFVGLLLLKFFNVDFSTVYFIIIGGFVSLIIYFIKLIKNKKKGDKDNVD